MNDYKPCFFNEIIKALINIPIHYEEINCKKSSDQNEDHIVDVNDMIDKLEE